MKKLFVYLFLASFISFVSCSTESIEEEVSEEINDPAPDGDSDEEEEEEDDGIVSDEPCGFDLSTLNSNSVVVINCILDLQGKTIDLPANITFEFDGGDIKNGTLNFSGGIIDGQLMNSSLHLNGSVTLKDPEFKFLASRWKNIKEGIVTKDVALSNKEAFQNLIDQIHEMQGNTFNVGKLDAFFLVGLPHKNPNDHALDAIHIPSNFHFKMSSNTYLRVQPNEFFAYTLLATHKTFNTKISGGNLVGDKFDHDYNTVSSTHEWGVLLQPTGSENVTIENVTLSNSTGDGIKTVATGLRNVDGSLPAGILECKNIFIRNNTIESCRRNNISIVDGTDIVVEDNLIRKAGDGNSGQPSDGVAPKFGIDLEAFRDYNTAFAEIKEYEKVTDVIIRNNTFEENEAGSIIIYSADGTIIESNTSDHMIFLREASNSIVRNNTITAVERTRANAAITMGDFRMFTNGIGSPLQQFALNNKVLNNTISGFNNGIRVRGSEGVVSGNKVYQFEQGLGIEKAEDTEIFDNEYVSSVTSSHGIVLIFYGNNIDIHDEIIDVDKRYLFTNEFNVDTTFAADIQSFEITIRNCQLNASKPSRLYNSYGVNLINNTINSTIEFVQSRNASFKDNTVNIIDREAIVIDDSVDVEITGNTITLDAFHSSIRGGNDSDIIISNNTFNQVGGQNVINLTSYISSNIMNNRANINESVNHFVYFRGNDSVLENNFINPNEERNDIEGSNNTVR